MAQAKKKTATRTAKKACAKRQCCKKQQSRICYKKYEKGQQHITASQIVTLPCRAACIYPSCQGH
jgi:hypothetical protein